MRTPIVMTALVAGLTLVAGSSAVARTGVPADRMVVTGPASVAPQPQRAVSTVPAHAATVTLLTGDKVRLNPTPDGGTSVTPLGGQTGARAAEFVRFSWAGDQYVVPSSAVPYLSSTLDVRLFDVSYLVRAGLDDAHGATVPVTLTGSGGAEPSAPPGVHVTRRSGGTATATVAKADAGKLGHRLAQQWRDSRTGASTLAVGTLPGITKIGLLPPSGAPALPAAPQQAPQAAPKTAGVRYHTLTFNSIDRFGNPGTMIGFIHNVDDARLGFFEAALPGQQGSVSFSVPEGTYSAEVTVVTGPGDDLSSPMALVVKPQFTVDSDETITLDARTAVPYQPKLQTPPPDGYARQDMLTFNRQAATGGGLRVQGFGFDGVGAIIAAHLVSNPETGNGLLYATPTQPVSKGTFDFAALTQLAASETDSQGKPRYNLWFPSKGGIPGSLTYQVPDSALTPVHSTIYRAACAACTDDMSLFPMVYLPWSGWSQNELAFGDIVPPGELTDYWYSSAPDLTVWQAKFDAGDGTTRWDERRTITPGRPIETSWNNTTYGPAPAPPYAQVPKIVIGSSGTSDSQVTDAMLQVCPACRQDDNGVINLQMLPDPDPTHFAEPTRLANSSLRFWRDGTLAYSSDGLQEGTVVPQVPLPMLRTAATYRLQWSWNGFVNTQAASDTTWTFRSAPGETSTLPKTEQCTPDPSRECGFLPLLFVRYDLPVDTNSQAKAGAPFKLAFTVSGQQNAPAPSGLSATVSVSYDDGRTWSQPQDATGLGDGRFGLTINHPDRTATSGFVSLRVQARDAAGNAVDQTSIRVYGLS